MAVTLQDLVIDLGAALRDNLEGTTSHDAVPANQFIDTSRKGGSKDRWVNSEVLFLDTAGMVMDNPSSVEAFDSVNSVFTLRDNWSLSTGVPANRRYVLMNLRGDGFPFYYRKKAIKQVMEYYTGVPLRVSLGVYSMENFYYDIPSNVDWVNHVKLERDESLNPTQAFFTADVSNRRWELLPGNKLYIKDRYGVASDGTFSVYIYGTGTPAFVDSLTSTYNVRGDLVVQDAAEWLMLLTENPAEQSGRNQLFQERVREDFEYRLPGSRKVI